MHSNFALYAFCILAIIIGVIALKKITGCVVKLLLFAATAIIIGLVYFLYFR